MYKFIIIIFSLFIFNTTSFGQQTPEFTLDVINLYGINKAFAGVNNQLTVFSLYRSQYTEIAGNPKSFKINATLPIYKLQGGIGIEIESYSNGPELNNQFQLSYNYIYPLSYGLVSYGISGGLSQIRIDSRKIITPDGVYQGGFDHLDLILDNEIDNALYPNYGLHAFFSNNYFDAGIQISNFIGYTSLVDEKINYGIGNFASTFFIYLLELPNNILYQPGIVVKTNFDVVQIKLLNTLKYGNVFGGIGVRGYSNRSIESISIFGGIKFNSNYTIGYNFDVIINQLRNTSEGTHEILFRYDLNKEINTGLPPKTMYNPRNL